jgi:hypothetical protein
MSAHYQQSYILQDPVGPGKVSINITVEYVTAIPANVESDFVDLINNQTSGLQCFDSADCQTNQDIDESTLTIVFNIPTSQGPDIDYSDYISSGIRKFYTKNIFVFCFMRFMSVPILF